MTLAPVACVVKASVDNNVPRLRGVTAGVHCLGEPGLPALAPVFANAVARITGKTPRELPFASA